MPSSTSLFPPAPAAQAHASPTISAIEVFSFSLPAHAAHVPPRLGTPSKAGRAIVLVKVLASDGSVGWGEAGPLPWMGPETRESVISTVGRYFAPALLRHPLADLDGLHRAMDGALAGMGGAPSMPLARAAVDLAAHDALARSSKLSLRDLLGHRRCDSVRLSWTVTGATPGAIQENLREAKERGYANATVRLGGPPAAEAELCALVKREMPGSCLRGMAFGTFPAHEALGRAMQLADAGLDILEQPLPPERADVASSLVARVPLAVAADAASPAALATLARAGAVNAVTIRLGRVGGLLPGRRCAEVAAAHGLLVLAAGMTDAGVASAAAAQFAAAFGLTTPMPLDGLQFLTEDLLATGLPRSGDTITIPADRAGLGVEVDEDKVRKLASQAGGTTQRVG